jgi:hypothetical protein
MRPGITMFPSSAAQYADFHRYREADPKKWITPKLLFALPVMNELQFLFPSEPSKPPKPRSLYVDRFLRFPRAAQHI